MIYLTGCHNEALVGDPCIGLMVQPGSYRRQIALYRYWAADNGCFAQGDAFDAEAWLKWLADLGHHDTCIFGVAPDVYGDPAATLRRSLPYLSTIRTLGYPAAFVAQDGALADELPWDSFDVLFIGGGTTWKLSPGASRLAAAAKKRGKPVHMGRVNSLRRLRAAVLMGCDSADGTFLAFRNRQHGQGRLEDRGVSELLGWLERLEREPFLPLELKWEAL